MIPLQASEAKPLYPLSEVLIFQVLVGASLLVHYPELRGVRYSGVMFILVGWCMGHMSVRRRCLLFGESVVRGSTVNCRFL